jgi:hypothetical protein
MRDILALASNTCDADFKRVFGCEHCAGEMDLRFHRLDVGILANVTK